MKFTPAKPFLLAETPDSLAAKLKAAGHPSFRAAQILDWVYKKFTLDSSAMTNLPQGLRAWLDTTFTLRPAKTTLVSGDTDATQKLLLELGDGSLIETVLIRAPISDEDDPANTGDDDEAPEANTTTAAVPSECPTTSPVLPLSPASTNPPNPYTKAQRQTVCISTQVGCAQGCKFCASGMAGWRRDLHSAEILAQLFAVIELLGARPSDKGPSLPFDNIVVMGMGEPFMNFDATMAALAALNAPWGFAFGARRVTVSTSGVVPRIRELAELPTQFRLAISLHGATDEVRSRIMPVNRKYPLGELIPAVAAYNARHNRMVTFEYILIDGVNDTPEQAEALIRLCAGLKVHVNCIPYNPVEGLPWKTPSIIHQQAFVRKLKSAGVSATVRHEKGRRIDAACGQLRLKEEQRRGSISPTPPKKEAP